MNLSYVLIQRNESRNRISILPDFSSIILFCQLGISMRAVLHWGHFPGAFPLLAYCLMQAGIFQLEILREGHFLRLLSYVGGHFPASCFGHFPV